jgi:hypothetical protein
MSVFICGRIRQLGEPVEGGHCPVDLLSRVAYFCHDCLPEPILQPPLVRLQFVKHGRGGVSLFWVLR